MAHVRRGLRCIRIAVHDGLHGQNLPGRRRDREFQRRRASGLPDSGAEETVSPGLFRKRVSGGDNVFAFRFEGTGTAYLKSFNDANGTMLLFR